MDARAQVGERLDGLQAASGDGREGISRWHHQVAERLARRAAHAPAQLVQLRQAEVLGVVDDDGVYARHVHAALDDGGGEQHVVVVGGEIDDGLFKFLGRHLAVGHDGAGVGDEAPDHVLELVKALDAVVDQEHLAPARHLEVYGLGHELVVHRGDGGDDGIAVGRRGGDGAEVARAHQRELQRARDGRGAHRQGVDVHLQLLELFLDGDAEFLFLVHHEQSQVFELHGLADELVGADYDVDFAGGQVGQDFLDLFGGAGAREVLDPDGEILQAL